MKHRKPTCKIYHVILTGIISGSGMLFLVYFINLCLWYTAITFILGNRCFCPSQLNTFYFLHAPLTIPSSLSVPQRHPSCFLSSIVWNCSLNYFYFEFIILEEPWDICLFVADVCHLALSSYRVSMLLQVPHFFCLVFHLTNWTHSLAIHLSVDLYPLSRFSLYELCCYEDCIYYY